MKSIFGINMGRNQIAWNKGRIFGHKIGFLPSEIVAIREILKQENKTRDLALFSIGIDSALRSVDLLPLQVSDVMGSTGVIKKEFLVKQQKTGNLQWVKLFDFTCDALKVWIEGYCMNKL